MRAEQFLCGMVVIALISLAPRATAQITLPDGPNRDLVSRTCSACHDLAMAVAARRTREGWNATIDEMVTYRMNVTPDERRLILDYLTTYLPPR